MYLAGRAFKRLNHEWTSRYHRVELQVEGDLPDLDARPHLIVANHGFGGVTDVNSGAFGTVDRALAPEHGIVALGHIMPWRLGMGAFMEGMDVVPAGPDAAMECFEAGNSVVVMPGGDVEAYKPFRDRNKVIFGGRTGFARLAMKAGVPILPVVTAGAGETLYCISRGEGLARLTGLQKAFRFKAFPITVSLPWGLNIGLVGMSLPYLPLPSKLTVRILAPMMPQEGEEAADFAARVQAAMQGAMDDMTKDRTFLLG